MNILRKHEIFEIEVLEKLKNAKLLEPLVFGGGTMLRLCYDLDRYSADLDFWFTKKTEPKAYFNKFRKFLEKEYELTDSKIKRYTLLFEIRSKDYPKRLKIEIRRALKDCDFQDRIAFSKYTTKQVILRVCTLEQTMLNKIEAATDRREIRDYFDIEFLLRRGIQLKASREKLVKLLDQAGKFKAKDFKVTLGSVLESNMRDYYVKNGFSYLLETVSRQFSSQ